MLRSFTLSAVFAIATLAVPAMAREDSAERIRGAAERYVTGNTAVIAAMAVDPQWVAGTKQQLADWLGSGASEVINQPMFAISQGLVQGLREAGAREAVALWGIDSSPNSYLPLVVLTTEDAERTQAVEQMASALLQMAGPDAKGWSVARDGNYVLVAPRERPQNAAPANPVERGDLVDTLEQAWTSAADTAGSRLALAISLGPTQRRVLRELWPDLGPPYERVTGAFLADDLRQLSLAATSPPEWRLELTVACRDEQAAQFARQLHERAWQTLLARIEASPTDKKWAGAVRQFAQLVAVEQQEATLRLSIESDAQAVKEFVAEVMTPTLIAMREDAQRAGRMRAAKVLALAMWNYESANKHLPHPAAIVDAEGKPLLSWRVAVLAYMDDQLALYKQFHFDEPWDSTHNKALIDKMPDVYASAGVREAGKTVYQVPVHEGSVFPSRQGELSKFGYDGPKYYYQSGTEIREVADGTSDTVLIVERAPEDAVIWTKPADWEVDLANAWQQLKGERTAGWITAAYCDGSSHAWDVKQDAKRLEEILPKLITRDGGEVID